MRHRDYIAEREARDPAFKVAREELRPEYEYRRALILARLQAGLTQQELAERLGTKQSAIARLESGGRAPRLDTLFQLAEALNVTFSITPDRRVIVTPGSDALTPQHSASIPDEG